MDFINYKLNNMENNRYLFFIFLIIIVFSLISSVSASNSLDIDNSNYNTILESNQVINSDNNLNNDDSLKLESSDKYEKDILSVSSVHIIPSDTTNDELQYIFDNSKSGDTIQFNDNVYNNISIVVNKRLNIVSTKNSIVHTSNSLSEKASHSAFTLASLQAGQ